MIISLICIIRHIRLIRHIIHNMFHTNYSTNKEKSLYYYISDKIYDESIGFDLDHTLIEPKSGNKLPVNVDDYKWMENVQNVLRNLKYNIVIFTNQLKFVPEFLNKIDKLKSELKIDFSIFISTENDMYRKPNIGSHNLYTQLTGNKITKYVGDACGRIDDHSFCDIYFANNLNIEIETPEHFFMNKTINYTYKEDPYNLYTNKYVCKIKNSLSLMPPEEFQYEHPCVIFMCGFSGSGKTTFCNTHLNKYAHVNQDQLKTKDKTKKMVQQHVKSNTSFVIDKTFATVEDRKEYLDLIPANYNKYCIHVNVPMFIARHLNHSRSLETNVKPVPDIVFRTFNKNFVKPTINEFTKVFEYIPDIKITQKLIETIQKSELTDLL